MHHHPATGHRTRQVIDFTAAPRPVHEMTIETLGAGLGPGCCRLVLHEGERAGPREKHDRLRQLRKSHATDPDSLRKLFK